MEATTVTPYRSGVRGGHDGFASLLHAEWTKFRTVRGWVIGMVVAVLVTAGVGLLGHDSCSNGNNTACTLPLGPDGEAVADSFYFVRQPLDGNGSITVRMTSLSGLIPNSSSSSRVKAGSGRGQGSQNMHSGLEPWAKAGIIIEENTSQGAAYAAMMVTGAHGVRMQYDYTHDMPGLPGAVSAAAPRWLRLTRSGDALTGYDSADGTHWTQVGTAHLAGLAATVQAGLFAASPRYSQVISQSLGGSSGTGGPTLATGALDHVGLRGDWPGEGWSGQDIGGPNAMYPQLPGGLRQVRTGLIVTGSGDIAPDVPGSGGDGTSITLTLVGAFAGLIAVIVVGTMFITAEYRRGLILITMTACPRRGHVLVAKAIVAGLVAFATGLVAAAIAVPIGERMLRQGGVFIDPVSTLAKVQLVAGTAALFAVAAILAVALGALLRRSTVAVTVAILAIVAPFVLGTVLSGGAVPWLLRVTPAAGFAIQQVYPRYPQVAPAHTALGGNYPLAPWAGFAVLCGWAATALGLAVFLLRRRDA